MKIYLPALLLVELFLLCLLGLPSKSYGQLNCSNYTVAPIPHTPFAATTGDTLVLGDDELSTALPIGFNFNFYCNTYTQFLVSSNGFITFDLQNSNVGCCRGQILPNPSQPDNVIACAWADLNPQASGTISYFTTGTTPNRRLVVQYDNVAHYGTTNTISTQIILHEGSNVIDIHSILIAANPGGAITQGIENMDATLGISVPGRNGSAWSSTAESYRFKPSPSIYGYVYQDFNQNCMVDTADIGLGGRNLLLNPGNLIVQSNSSGTWNLDSLPIGTYTVTVDTSGSWLPTCPTTQTFTVVHPDSTVIVPAFGFISTAPCSDPSVSINAPFLRPGFSNQRVYVQACNGNLATAPLDSGYVVVELDSLLTVQSGTLPYTSLGNNQYRVDVGTLNPGTCISFSFGTTLSTSAVLGQSLCLEAILYPVDSCALDTLPNTAIGIPCTTLFDNSNLAIDATCINGDTISFTISNTEADMSCWSQVRLYIDGVLVRIDSVQLQGGQSQTFNFAGDGRTWRMEVDQHPLHWGNSQPSATIELCGDPANWTPNLVNVLPHDDADNFVDIFCGVVRGSYDPNDKRGFPLGVGSNNHILPNQDLEYIIRFQNTGTDTAFTVVIRDTLPMNLDILSVRSGVSSHDYEFEMKGPRVLEWTFNNIMLPDSNVNEPLSNGFVTFKVKQVPNLLDNSLIENSAGIYFDFNAPIITNTSTHTINDGIVFFNSTEVITQEMGIKVYPNPTSNYLTVVKETEEEVTLTLLNNLGQVLLTQSFTGTTTQVPLSTLPTGLYYLHLHDGTQTAIQKIIKQ